jgi:phosphinothricin acetyltransferase
MSPCVVRTATKADAPAITDLLNHYIQTSTSLFILEAQTLEERLAWLEERSELHPALVAEINGTFVGWGALSVHNPRAGYRHSADTSVYVHPDHHRRGVGRAILSELIARARAVRHHTLIALCCSESAASIALHEALGFTRAGELREVGRKFDRWLNVTHLQLML